MVTIYAEKFDVGVKIAATLGGFDYEGTLVTMKNVEKLKTKLEKDVKRKGVIYIKYEGEQYAVTWGQGHMCGLMQARDYDPEYRSWSKMPMPFFPEEYKIKIREGRDGGPDPWTSRQLGLIKALFEKSDSIINATDDDREGECIFAYVYEIIGVHKPYRRMIMDSQTEEGFLHSFHNLKPSSAVRPIEMAGRGRAIADWMVGANLTAIMSMKYGGYGADSLVSVGRVQTPVLNILVERERAIRNFKSEPFWYIVAEFTTSEGETYTARHTETQIKDKPKAEELFDKVNGKQGTITEYEKSPAKKEVPLLYNLTTLSMEANKQYGITAADTLATLQELYMAGLVTYPRSSSQHLTDDMRPVADEVLDMLAGYSDDYNKWIKPVTDRNYTKRHFDTSKVESHYAIIPTKVKPGKLTQRQEQIYDLVAQSLIRIIYKPAVLEKTKIVTEVEGEQFKSSGTVVKDPQWLSVGGMKDSEDLLPALTQGETVDGEYQIKEGKTEPPKRYTDSSLLLAMVAAGKNIEDDELKKVMLENTQDGGIGTESTRAKIIDTVVARGYAERVGNKKVQHIVPTEKGMKVIEILPLTDLKSAELTAKWEKRLHMIEKGEDTFEAFIMDMQEMTLKWVREIQESEVTEKIGASQDDNTLPVNCPNCGKPMKKLSWGWACSGYKKDDPSSCRFAIGYDVRGAKLSDSDIDSIITKKRSRYIDGFKKKDSNETYGAFIILDDNNKLSMTWETGIQCPKCGKPITVNKKGWGCSGWREGCPVTVWNEVAGKKLRDSDKIALLTKGETKEIKGLTKRDGSKFDAALIFDEQYKIKYKFSNNKKNK